MNLHVRLHLCKIFCPEQYTFMLRYFCHVCVTITQMQVHAQIYTYEGRNKFEATMQNCEAPSPKMLSYNWENHKTGILVYVFYAENTLSD